MFDLRQMWEKMEENIKNKFKINKLFLYATSNFVSLILTPLYKEKYINF